MNLYISPWISGFPVCISADSVEISFVSDPSDEPPFFSWNEETLVCTLLANEVDYRYIAIKVSSSLCLSVIKINGILI